MAQRHYSPSENLAAWNAFIDRGLATVRRLPLSQIPSDSGRSVVMIEPRCHPHLEYVLRNVMYFVGKDWGLELFASPVNRPYLEQLTNGWGSVRFHPLEVMNLSTVDYNQLKKDPRTWERISSEHTLWIEPDCLLCRHGIEEYMDFDYIGAPWHEELAISPSCRVGNGGLSLRRRSAMLEIAERANRDHRIILSEDVFFCVNMHLRNIANPGTYRLPSFHVASTFAVESVFHPSPLGMHKIWKYLPIVQVRHLLRKIEY